MAENFDCSFYYNTYKDIREKLPYNYSKLLSHWKNNGKREGRLSILFDISNNPSQVRQNYNESLKIFKENKFAIGKEGFNIISSDNLLDHATEVLSLLNNNQISANINCSLHKVNIIISD